MKIILKIFAILGTLCFGLIIVTTLFFSKDDGEVFISEDYNDSKCQVQKRVKFLVWSGIVDSVFEDKNNHSINTLIVNTGSGLHTIYLEHEQSGLFNYLNKGDSVYKKYNEYKVTVLKDNTSKIFKLDYGCNENIKE